MPKNVRIALDGMGGDRAPRVVVDGAVQAASMYDYQIILVGDTRKIGKFLNLYNYPKDKISIAHASEAVKMGEAAAASFRKKKNSSIIVGLNLVKEKKADIFVSAGNTGAVVTAAALGLKLLPFVERPGIAIPLPTVKEPILLIDGGANIVPAPSHLFQYAVMADAYSRYIFKREKPSIGLLNIGEEETKGTDLIKETRELLKKSRLNFVGNVEARDVFKGRLDVVICDGFVGNIVLKVIESFAEVSTQLLKQELNRRLLPKIGAILSLPAYRAIRKKIDYTEYGGAPLLGVDGAVLICHGSSNGVAIRNAVRVAGDYVKHDVNKHIIEGLKANQGVEP